jgi:type I restriction enzyme S subunit
VSGWPRVALGEVLRRADRFEAKDELAEYTFAGTYSFARGIFRGDSKLGSAFRLPIIQRVQAGDFVYCKIMAWEGAFGIAPREVDGCVLSGAFVVYEVDVAKLEPSYLDWYFKQRAVWEKIGSRSTGTNVRRRSLHPSVFEAFEMPLPPIGEQRRVVRRIENLAARSRRAQQHAEKVKSSTTALASARTHAVFASLECSTLPLAELADIRGGMQRTPSREPGNNPVRYLTVAHVHRDKVSTDDPRYFEVSSSELERYRLLSGDVLIIEGNGSATEIGRAAMFNGEIDPCVHQNHVIRVRPDAGLITSTFLNAYLNSPLGREEVQRRSRTTSGLRSLSVGRIKQIEVPVPSLDDQARVVQGLRNLKTQELAVAELRARVEGAFAAVIPSLLRREM